MINISDEKWEQIVYYFENLCDDTLYVCPRCGSIYKDGYICGNCSYDDSGVLDDDKEEWTYEE